MPKPVRLVSGAGGFTLVEMLLVIGLLALLAVVLISSGSDLLRTREPRPDDAFWSAVVGSRQLALETNRTVTLRYDQEKRLLTWSVGADAGRTLAFPGRLLEFLPVVSTGTVLIGGQLTETTNLTRIRFFPDGGCDSFRAQLTDETGRRTVLAIDPWTCAPVIAADTTK